MYKCAKDSEEKKKSGDDDDQQKESNLNPLKDKRFLEMTNVTF